MPSQDTNQVEAFEAGMQEMFGRMKAIELALRISLDTHPAPGALLNAWLDASPTLRASSIVPQDHPSYVSGLDDGLAAISKQIAGMQPKISPG